MSNAYIIYTDGSTVNNGKEGARGGYGVVFVSERSLDTSGYFTDGPQTKCRYELEAIATEIALDVHNHHILIKTGSENSKKSITTWLKTWKQNGFITAKGKPVQLRWLFEEIDQNIINIRAHGNIVAFQHVEEHVTDEFHIEASCLAKTAAAKNAHDEGVKLTLLEDRTLQLELDENIDFMQKNLHLKDSMTQWFPMMISGAGKEYPSEIEQILYKFLELCSKIDLPESVKAVVPSSSTEPGTQHLRAHIEPIRLFLSTGKPSNRDSLEKLFHDVKKSICIGQKAYIIYTDGSALNENKEGARGGYGVVFESERARDTSGHFADGPQTNNRYELEAIKIATEVALDVHNHHILIRTDSEISIRCVTENVKKWVTNGFINSNGKPVQNRRLIEEIDDNIINIRAQGKMIQFEHVSGRDSNIYSKDAYRLARTAALNAREIEFKSYIIYTDGSTVDNGKEGARGGYGVVCLFDRQLDTSGSFSFGNQTNNRYELEAIKKAIDIIRRVNHNHFIIRTDSEYSLKSVTEYVKTWKKNGWKTASGDDVENKKLIEKIHRYVMMLADRSKIVKFEHVKGHGTDEFNIEADRLARAAATGSDAIHEKISSDEEDFYYTPITHSYDVDVEDT